MVGCKQSTLIIEDNCSFSSSKPNLERSFFFHYVSFVLFFVTIASFVACAVAEAVLTTGINRDCFLSAPLLIDGVQGRLVPSSD